MGQLFSVHHSSSILLPEEKIQEYLSLTYLTKEEILKAFEKFHKMEPDIDPESHNPAISLLGFNKIEEFQANPFKDRLIKFFTDPSAKCMTFEDYLDMMSVFSPHAPLILKAEYAFRIYDFDGDGLLSRDDLKELLNRLQGESCEEISAEDVEEIVDSVMKDCDLDRDGLIVLPEFHRLVQKLENFSRTFVMRL